MGAAKAQMLVPTACVFAPLIIKISAQLGQGGVMCLSLLHREADTRSEVAHGNNYRRTLQYYEFDADLTAAIYGGPARLVHTLE